MDIKYYPGCTIKTSARNYETSALAALQALGVELNEMEDWNCCGVVHSLTTDDLYHQIAPVRVLNHLEHEGRSELVTLCDMCYNTLAQANVLVTSDAEKLKTLNTFMDTEEPYGGSVEVLHLLEILRDKVGFQTIAKRVKRPLKGLKVFPYYGCMLLRPGEVGIDNAEDPTILGDLMAALGAEVIDDPVKVECCGSHHTVGNCGVVFDRVEKIVERAKAKGAEAMVLSCPLCRFNLDARQQEDPAITEPLPVFYYTQLMAVAFGLGEEVLGLDDHRVDPCPLLRERGMCGRHDGEPHKGSGHAVSVSV
jgi:heterodisulfide reductase subunit B2